MGVVLGLVLIEHKRDPRPVGGMEPAHSGPDTHAPKICSIRLSTGEIHLLNALKRQSTIAHQGHRFLGGIGLPGWRCGGQCRQNR